MNTLYIKIIFLICTIEIFLYSVSYAKFEIIKKNNIFGGIMVFIFSLASVIFSNVMFFVT